MDVLKHNEAPQAQPVEGLRCNFSSRNRFLIVEEGVLQPANFTYVIV